MVWDSLFLFWYIIFALKVLILVLIKYHWALMPKTLDIWYLNIIIADSGIIDSCPSEN